MARDKEYHDRLQAAGLCVRCAKESPDRTVCRECYKKNETQKTKRRKELREAGLCARCKFPSEGFECAECVEVRNAKRRQRWEENKEQISKKRKAKYQEKRAKGICIYCSNKADGGALCSLCKAGKTMRVNNKNEVIEISLSTGEEPSIAVGGNFFEAEAA